MIKIPRSILALFGEFIVEHNQMDFKLKMFLSSFVEDESIGHLLVSSQPFEFVKKRVNSVFKKIIEDEKLTQRWDVLQEEISQLNEVRNDIAHSVIDIDPDTRKLFVMTRFTESTVLKLGQRDKLYELSDLKAYVSRLKKINRKLSYLFHTTFRKHHDVAYYSGTGMMF